MIQDSPEWHEWRKSGIGASEIASIYPFTQDGKPIEAYDTIYGVWLVKSGRSKGFAGNSFTEHGKVTEAKARARYELLTMRDMPPACASHPVFKRCLASLDGWNQEEARLFETKCPKGEAVIAAAVAGQVAPIYIPQVHYQLGVTGAKVLDFFVYHEETDRDALVEVLPDVQYQGRLFAAAEDFWEKYVIPDIAPPLTDRDVKVVTDDRIAALCTSLKIQKELMSKETIDNLKAEIVYLSGHPKMRCGDVQISTVNRSGKFSYHKLTIVNGVNHA